MVLITPPPFSQDYPRSNDHFLDWISLILTGLMLGWTLIRSRSLARSLRIGVIALPWPLTLILTLALTLTLPLALTLTGP